MEIFITAPQGGGKSTMARKIAMEYSILNRRTQSEPTRITEVTAYDPLPVKDIKGSDIIIFDDIHRPEQLARARQYYADNRKAKHVCIYVSSSELSVQLRDDVVTNAQLTRLREKTALAINRGKVQEARKLTESYGVIRLGLLDPKHYDDYETSINMILNDFPKPL